MSEKTKGGPEWDVASAIQVKFRCPEGLKGRIDRAAEEHQVSMSAEITRRLEESFQADRRAAVEDALIGDKAGAQVVRAVAAVVAGASRHNWTEDGPARIALQRSLQDVIERLVPAPASLDADEANLGDLLHRLFGSTVNTFAHVEPHQWAEDVVLPLKRA